MSCSDDDGDASPGSDARPAAIATIAVGADDSVEILRSAYVKVIGNKLDELRDDLDDYRGSESLAGPPEAAKISELAMTIQEIDIDLQAVDGGEVSESRLNRIDQKLESAQDLSISLAVAAAE